MNLKKNKKRLYDVRFFLNVCLMDCTTVSQSKRWQLPAQTYGEQPLANENSKTC